MEIEATDIKKTQVWHAELINRKRDTMGQEPFPAAIGQKAGHTLDEPLVRHRARFN